MKKNIYTFVIVVVAIFSLTTQSFSETLEAVQGNHHGRHLKRELKAYFNDLADQKLYSGSVLIARNGRVLLKKGFGLANYETGKPNTPRTAYAIASMTKAFTAMSILMLEERGLLSVDDKLSAYFPDYPNGDNITLKNLLKMNAGIGAMFEADDPVVWANVSDLHTTGQLFQYFLNDPIFFEPGTQWNYCNSCYVLLGMIIEQVSNVSFGDFVKINITEPLNMNTTSYDPEGLDFANKRAVPYDNLNSGPPPISVYFHPTLVYSAGAIFSTVTDMYKWDRALYTEQLISQEHLDEMFTPGLGNYGYGWYVETMDVCGETHNLMWHWGSYLGYHGFIGRLVDDDVFIIMLQNTTSPDLYNSAILMPKARDVAEIIFGNN